METTIQSSLAARVFPQNSFPDSKIVAGILIGVVLYNSSTVITGLSRAVGIVQKIFSEVFDFIGRCFFDAKNPFPNGKYADPTLNQKEIARFTLCQQRKLDRAVKQSNVTPLIVKFLDDPKVELINIRKNTSNPDDCPETYFIHLYECACSGLFDRFCNSRRSDIEIQLLKNTQELCPKDQELRYLGIGIGGGLQDFINLGKLIKAGYKSIKAVLVDSNFTTFPETFKKLQTQMSYLEIFAQEMKAQLSISYLSSTSETHDKFHVIQQIDLCDLYQAGRSAALLEDKGRFYLAFKTYDLFFSKLGLLYTKFFHEISYKMTELTQAMKEAAQKIEAEHLQIAFLSPHDWLTQFIQILPVLCSNSAVKKVSLTLFYIQVKNIPELAQILSLITGKKVEVFIEEKRYDPISSSTYFDIVTALFFSCSEDRVKTLFQSFSKDFPKTICFFDIQATTENPTEIPWSCACQLEQAGGIKFFENPSNAAQERVTGFLQKTI